MSCTDKMYLTGNEICSDNPRDLSDNARVFDAYVNSAEFSVTDRFGIERVTLAWAKWRVDNAIDEATGEIRAEWQTGVANINSEETAALNNINTTTAASLTSIEEAKDNAIEEIIETGGVDIAQEPGQDTNKVMSQKAVTDFVSREIDSIDTSNLVSKDAITNELGDSTELVASQALASKISDELFGINQDFYNVTSERTANAIYQNTTKKAIQIFVNFARVSSEFSLSISRDKSGWFSVGLASAGVSLFACITVPPGYFYKINASFLTILELR